MNLDPRFADGIRQLLHLQGANSILDLAIDVALVNLDLVAGRIDGGLADYSVWKAFLESRDGAMAVLYGPRISGGLFGPGVGIGLRKQDKELAEQFNDAIEAIEADGVLREISLKWFGADLVSN